MLPGGYPRRLTGVTPNFNAFLNYQHVTKFAEQLTDAQSLPDVMRRAFAHLRSGRPRPVLIEIPADVFREDIDEPLEYQATFPVRSAPDPSAVRDVARVLLEAARPVIYAGQGVHYVRAWDALRELAELLEIPVTTSLQGKSAFPEDHPLSLGSGGRSVPKAVHDFLRDADVVFGIGCSFATTSYGVSIPPGKVIVHATLDPDDINKELPVQYALVGDARLVLEALLSELREALRNTKRDARGGVASTIEATKDEWLAQWQPKLTSAETPLSPYRVIWDLMRTVDRRTTIITHDAGSPRDQLSPFWESLTPLSYIGWGKTTQLGYGLGLTMGAKLAHPDRLCINVWGDAAIGMTGMDFETAVRERIPILSILLNNSSMAIELPVMPAATAKYRSTDISGHYADMAKAFGGYGERVSEPAQIVPAILRGVETTRAGTPALLEFITAQEIEYSIYR